MNPKTVREMIVAALCALYLHCAGLTAAIILPMLALWLGSVLIALDVSPVCLFPYMTFQVVTIAVGPLIYRHGMDSAAYAMGWVP